MKLKKCKKHKWSILTFYDLLLTSKKSNLTWHPPSSNTLPYLVFIQCGCQSLTKNAIKTFILDFGLPSIKDMDGKEKINKNLGQLLFIVTNQ